MLHVKQIEQLVEQGQADTAYEALDQLLALGPKNTAALKLKAALYSYEGRFEAEAAIWDQIARIDNEDEDAITYYYQKQIEDREHFYFTDDLPGGGRRYLAQPKAFFTAAITSVLSCLTFVYVSVGLSKAYPQLKEATLFFGLFFLLVVGPWLRICYLYVKSLKSISVSEAAIEVATRFRQISFKWQDLEQVYLASNLKTDQAQLKLVLVPKAEAQVPQVEIDLNQDSSAIRARSYLVRDIKRMFGEPTYAAFDKVPAKTKKVHIF